MAKSQHKPGSAVRAFPNMALTERHFIYPKGHPRAGNIYHTSPGGAEIAVKLGHQELDDYGKPIKKATKPKVEK